MYLFRLFAASIIILITISAQAADPGCRLEFRIRQFEGKEVILAHYFGDKILVDDTLQLQASGAFVFTSEKQLPSGMYVLVLPPENRMMDLLVTEAEQHFVLETDATRLTEDAEFKNANDNRLFYDYIQFMQAQRPEYDTLVRQLQQTEQADRSRQAKEKRDKLQKKVKNRQNKFVEKSPPSLTAAIIRANQELTLPSFEGDSLSVRQQQYFYQKEHYFDGVKDDPRIFTSRLFFDKTVFFLDKMTLPLPDSIKRSVSQLLHTVEPNTDAFRFYFIYVLNKYIQSKQIGMDAVYVHLVNEYVRTGKTPFLSEKDIKTLTENAAKWEPLLAGNPAPPLQLYELDVPGTLEKASDADEHKRFALKGAVNLYEVNSPFTILIFWRPGCGHCKEEMPHWVEFYRNYRDKGVEVLAIPVGTYKDMPAVADMLEKNKATEWTNAVDPYLRSRFPTLYAVDQTPEIYILDADKKILLRGNVSNQLDKVMDELLKMK